MILCRLELTLFETGALRSTTVLRCYAERECEHLANNPNSQTQFVFCDFFFFFFYFYFFLLNTLRFIVHTCIDIERKEKTPIRGIRNKLQSHDDIISN